MNFFSTQNWIRFFGPSPDCILPAYILNYLTQQSREEWRSEIYLKKLEMYEKDPDMPLTEEQKSLLIDFEIFLKHLGCFLRKIQTRIFGQRLVPKDIRGK